MYFDTQLRSVTRLPQKLDILLVNKSREGLYKPAMCH